MQGLRRLATAALQGGRTMSSYAHTANQITGKSHGSGKADQIGLMIMLPLAAGFIAYDVFYPEEEFEGQIPPYPYLRVRTRDSFPWGSDMGPFEHHRKCKQQARQCHIAS